MNTGVTFANAANVVREAGASEIYAVASHGLFTSGAADVLEKADIKEIFGHRFCCDKPSQTFKCKIF